MNSYQHINNGHINLRSVTIHDYAAHTLRSPHAQNNVDADELPKANVIAIGNNLHDWSVDKNKS
jgi:hypothetical protein